MHPVILDLGFWFCDNAHDAPCKLICQALFDEEYPFRFVVILLTFVFLAVTQIVFYACCVVGPFVICKCFSNPPEHWFTSTDDSVWRNNDHPSGMLFLSLAETKTAMRKSGTLDHVHFLDWQERLMHERIHHDVCPICLSNYQGEDELVVSRSCQHAFHEDCLARWLARQPICPCCRVPILANVRIPRN